MNDRPSLKGNQMFVALVKAGVVKPGRPLVWRPAK